MKDGARELGVSARETRHVAVAEIFNTGFVTTYHTAGDALAIFSAVHTKLGGGTWSNVATASALSYSTLQNAILAFESQTDHRGKKMMQSPMTLLCPPALEYKALELLETIGQPENANNTINAVKRARPSLRLVVWPYLTSATAWFLIGDNARMATGLIHFERIGVQFGKEGDFDTGDAKFKTRFRISTEVNNPIGLYGNAGA
jgi:phage major head subunit gpT-like protein